jgi:hypothetical protein
VPWVKAAIAAIRASSHAGTGILVGGLPFLLSPELQKPWEPTPRPRTSTEPRKPPQPWRGGDPWSTKAFSTRSPA